MRQIARFFKVSEKIFGTEHYNDIKPPVRATSGSAGYDFFAPYDIILEPRGDLIVPTGIRAEIHQEWALLVFPRSGLGFKYGLSLANTVGVIDSDYFYSENEGHIQIKLINGNERLEIKKGAAFAQGIFLRYGLTVDDNAGNVRNGGFGSTD